MAKTDKIFSKFPDSWISLLPGQGPYPLQCRFLKCPKFSTQIFAKHSIKWKDFWKMVKLYMLSHRQQTANHFPSIISNSFEMNHWRYPNLTSVREWTNTMMEMWGLFIFWLLNDSFIGAMEPERIRLFSLPMKCNQFLSAHPKWLGAL